MYVSRARMQNFKAFRDFTLPLQEGLNVIAGNNDAGKSTLLEALHLVLAASYRGRTIGTAISEDLFNRACMLITPILLRRSTCRCYTVPRLADTCRCGNR